MDRFGGLVQTNLRSSSSSLGWQINRDRTVYLSSFGVHPQNQSLGGLWMAARAVPSFGALVEARRGAARVGHGAGGVGHGAVGSMW